MGQKPQNICLISVFSHKAFFVPLSHLREILGEISPGLHLILAVSPEFADTPAFDGEKDDIIVYKKHTHPLFRLVNYCVLHLNISKKILLESKNVESYVFFWATGFFLPMVCAKLRKKQIIWLLPSSQRKMDEHHTVLLNIFLIPLQSLSYALTDKIVLYSPNLIQEWKLHKYADKILIGGEHFIHSDTFRATIPLSRRPLTIGYIGRLSEEKGVRNFVSALPAILHDRKDLHVLIGGDGPLKDEVMRTLDNQGLTSRVDHPDWISHDDLPGYLNRLQLLLIPSFTEGLPNILLEAMACGTPVAATPVGAIPNIIQDGENGFIMDNNSPGCISENILRALKDPHLEKIAVNARKMAEREFSFEHAVTQWNRILREK